ncbi:MAG: Rrf2 family transcriptional regulator [Verrucomicrobiales bacterium]|nr:Rrf2 family transcriptional regulator [Verrucomicrobiales bacterium]
MRLSLRGEYALRAMLALGQRYGSEVVRIRDVAAEQRIPKRFLEQILNDLKDARVVESRRGVQGGYRLARAPELISLAEVIRHIDGPLAPVSCVSERFYEPCSCPDESRCGLRSIMREVRDAISKQLEGVTVADLCARSASLQVGKEGPSMDFAI